jgi:hypothetical protein
VLSLMLYNAVRQHWEAQAFLSYVSLGFPPELFQGLPTSIA